MNIGGVNPRAMLNKYGFGKEVRSKAALKG